MTQRILFVCLGNICRSPSAEAVTRALAAAAGRDLTLDSAGTSGWHIGDPPHPPMVAAARAAGYDLSPLRARQVGAADFTAFDLIVAMDRDNLAALHASAPEAATARLALMTDFAETAATDVPDPYYTQDFAGVLRLIETCAEGLLAQLDQTQTTQTAPR